MKIGDKIHIVGSKYYQYPQDDIVEKVFQDHRCESQSSGSIDSSKDNNYIPYKVLVKTHFTQDGFSFNRCPCLISLYYLLNLKEMILSQDVIYSRDQ